MIAGFWELVASARESMKRLKILILGVPLLPVCMASFVQAENGFLVHTRAISGRPHVVLARGEKISLEGGRSMRPGDRIITSGSSRALIHFSQRPGCLLALELEPNSSFKLMSRKPDGAYFAKLDRGVMKCRSSSCGLSLSVATPTGMLSGKDAMFTLQAYRHSTTVTLARGRMRLLVSGQAFSLREMTRTTVSKTGEHRIATMRGGDFRIYSPRIASPPAALSPVSINRPDISPAAATRRP